MSQLAQIQQQFILVLQGADPTRFAEMLVTQGTVSTLTRIDIYRNGYYLRLQECIETDHEILAYFLGNDLFDEMVSGYIKTYPSQQTSLRYFGEQLPVFLAYTSPFCEHPVIAELARFERCLLTVFDAPDADTADLNMLKQIKVSDWPQLHFRLHPSVQRYQSDYHAVDIWQALKKEQVPPEADNIKQNWLVWRNAERLTEFSSLNTVEYIMFEGIIKGQNYAQLCAQLARYISLEEVSETSVKCLLNWLGQGIISKLLVENE